MGKITSNFYDSKYYKMQTDRELTRRTLPFISSIDVSGKNVLEIGCGSGQYIELIEKNSNMCCGFDYSKDALRICKRRGLCNVFLASADRIPISEQIFDVVMLIDVVEHLYNNQFLLCIKDVDRVLKPGGIVAIKTPCADIIPKFIRKVYNKLMGYQSHNSGEGHVNEMTPHYLVSTFEKHGFTLLGSKINDTSRYMRLNKFINYRLGGNMEMLFKKQQKITSSTKNGIKTIHCEHIVEGKINNDEYKEIMRLISMKV